MNSYGTEALAFLVQIGFGLFLLAFLLRLLLQLLGADFYNPLSQLLVRMTHPVLRPIRRLLPAVGRVDTASVIVLLILQSLEILILAALRGAVPNAPGLLVLAIGQLLALTITIYYVLLLIRVVLSFMPASGVGNPVIDIVYELTRPVLLPLQRVIPPTGMFDWSVLAAFVLLGLARILIVAPLLDIGRALA